MTENGAIQKLKAKLYCRLSEIVLAALLTVSISVFVYGLSVQAQLEGRQRESETQIALNAQRIGVLREAMKTNQAATSKQIDEILERVDQRCDTLEAILNIIAERGETGGK